MFDLDTASDTEGRNSSFFLTLKGVTIISTAIIFFGVIISSMTEPVLIATAKQPKFVWLTTYFFRSQDALWLVGVAILLAIVAIARPKLHRSFIDLDDRSRRNMYNFSVPSQLKGWIDRVCVAGRTFQYGPNGPQGLLPEGKKVVIASTRGGVYTGDSPAAELEHHESYLRGVLGFIGLIDVTIIRAEGLNLGEEPKAAAIAGAKAQIASLAA